MLTLGQVLQQYTFVELWSPMLILFLVGVAIVYLLFVGPRRSVFPDSEHVHPLRKVAFLSGLVILYLVQGTPIDILGHHYLFSAHMLQMAVMYMVVPPLLLSGLPVFFYRYVLRHWVVAKAFAFLTKPIFAIVMFNVLFSFYHFPVIFDTMMHQHALHSLYHSILFFSSFFMWWPILGILPELERLTHLRKVGYILGGSVLITPVCALVIFSPNVLYHSYMHAPQLFSLLPSLDDQQLGGVIMKIVQEGAYATGLAIIFVQWVRSDNSSSRIDPIQDGGSSS